MWEKPDPIDQILECLESESALLTSGRFGDLSKLPDRKAELLERMEVHQINPARLQHVRDKAGRNARLLQQAVQAMREVSGRLRAVTDQKPAFQSYTSGGGRCTIGGYTGQVSRKL